MRGPSYFTHEEYQLTKVALERSDVPAEALALLSTWIEGEGLLVDDREDVGGINFCRMDARVMAPLPHIVASFFARRPYKRKAGHYPNWNGFYLLLYRDMEKGWQLVQIRKDSPDTQFVPVLAARSKAVEEIRNEKQWPRGGDEHMSQHHSLTINVNNQCAIDAGYWQECVAEDQTPYRLVSPPQTTMYRQVLSYLEETTSDEKVPPQSQLHFGEVAIATVAICIRWRSYFAVLTNRDLSQWAATFDPEVSCIADGEMARINIETSAALSDWIDLMRADRRHFRKLVKAAVQLLPFPIAQLDGSTYYHRFRAFSAFNSATGRRYLMGDFEKHLGSERLEREMARVLINPTRALANGMLNEHWRNGSGIEDVHAGGIAPPRPLTQRRLTRAQEALLMQETAELFVPTMRTIYHVVSKPSEETWPERALPYALAFKPPADWSLDEQTREIAMPDAEPR